MNFLQFSQVLKQQSNLKDSDRETGKLGKNSPEGLFKVIAPKLLPDEIPETFIHAESYIPENLVRNKPGFIIITNKQAFLFAYQVATSNGWVWYCQASSLARITAYSEYKQKVHRGGRIFNLRFQADELKYHIFNDDEVYKFERYLELYSSLRVDPRGKS